MAKEIVTMRVDELRPHPENKDLYDRPTANSEYKRMWDDMKQNGFSDLQPLIVTADRRVIGGCTRWAIARGLKVETVPCIVFTPQSADPEEAEEEIVRELIRDNQGRRKSERTVAKELRRLVKIESVLARKRMAHGAGGEPGKAVEKVGKERNLSGSSVQKRIKVLNAIEAAEDRGDTKKANRLEDLLNARKIDTAINVIKGKPAAPKPAKVEVPDTFNSRYQKAYSEFFEACCKVMVPGELDQLRGLLARMAEEVEKVERRLNA
jgi:hypothetical protein